MKNKLKILHLEDLPTDAELVERELKKGKINFELLVVDNKAQFEKALVDFLPDIILSDHSLASFDSLEALRLVKQAGTTVPFILVTATMTDEFAVQILNEGAKDYIIKDRLHRLPSAVINSIEKHRLEEERQIYLKSVIQSEARLKEAQAIAHIGNWEIDFVENKQRWSDELYQIYGINKDEVQPSTELFLSFMHPDDSEFAQKEVQKVFETSKPTSFNFRFIRKNGDVRHGHSVARFEFGKNNTPIRLYGIVQDITERKIAEEKLEQQNKELLKTNSELDRFVYSVSHDLRAPLSSMLGVLEISEDDTTDERMLENLRMLKGNVRKLDEFISEILEYSRNSRLEVKKEEINFKELLDTITQNLKYMGDNNGMVDIKIDVDNKVCIHADKNRLSIILNNLISNAIRYKNTGITNPFVDVKIENSGTERGVSISISDNGIGIRKELHQKIFDMFYRVSDKSVGSGLGLYIVKETVAKLNGSIDVQSEPGKGSTFIVKIPNLI